MAQNEVDPRDQARYNSLIAAGRDDIVLFAEEILGIKLHEGQKEWLRQSLKMENGRYVYKIVTLAPSNQWGKTLLEAGVVKPWQAFYKKQLIGYSEKSKLTSEYPQLYASPHSQQLDRAWKYMTQIVEGRFVWEEGDKKMGPNKSLIPWAITKKSDNPYYVRWFNGAETIFRSTGEDGGASVSASPYADITYDEACRSYHLKDEINGVLIPRTTKYGAQIRIPSTPWMKSPSKVYFKEMFKKGIIDATGKREPGFYSMGGSLYDNEFLPSEEMTRVEAMTDPSLRRQTIYGEFVDSFGSYFDGNSVDMIFKNKLIDFEAPDSIFQYVITWDPAFGGDDNSAFHVYKVQDNDYFLVRREVFKGNTVSPESQFSIARNLYNEYNKGTFVFDGSGPQGKLIFSKIQDIDPVKINFATDKGAILMTLKDFLNYGRSTVRTAEGIIVDKNDNFGRIKSPFVEQLAKELSDYPGPDDDVKAECDDVVAMALLAWYVDKINDPMESYDIDILSIGQNSNQDNSPIHYGRRQIQDQT
jgi:hypothetical protein